MININEFGSYLRQLRKDRGLTLKELEKLAGLSYSYLSQLETGSRGTKGRPLPDVLDKLAGPLRVSYSELMIKAGYWQSIVDYDKSREENTLILHVPVKRYEKIPLGKGTYTDTLIEPEEQFRRLRDLWFILKNTEDASYFNRHLITDKDRELILTYLEALFSGRK